MLKDLLTSPIRGLTFIIFGFIALVWFSSSTSVLATATDPIPANQDISPNITPQAISTEKPTPIAEPQKNLPKPTSKEGLVNTITEKIVDFEINHKHYDWSALQYKDGLLYADWEETPATGVFEWVWVQIDSGNEVWKTVYVKNGNAIGTVTRDEKMNTSNPPEEFTDSPSMLFLDGNNLYLGDFYVAWIQEAEWLKLNQEAITPLQQAMNSLVVRDKFQFSLYYELHTFTLGLTDRYFNEDDLASIYDLAYLQRKIFPDRKVSIDLDPLDPTNTLSITLAFESALKKELIVDFEIYN